MTDRGSPAGEGGDAFYELTAPLEEEPAEAVAGGEDPAELLDHLGPPPPWSVPSQLRDTLKPVYRAAARLARHLLGSGS